MLESHVFTLVVKKLINVFSGLCPFLLHVFPYYRHEEMALLLLG